MLNGARTGGKSTLLAAIGAQAHRRVLDFDDLATREAVAVDPALFAAGPTPVLICSINFHMLSTWEDTSPHTTTSSSETLEIAELGQPPLVATGVLPPARTAPRPNN